jgi:hypothetical protein
MGPRAKEKRSGFPSLTGVRIGPAIYALHILQHFILVYENSEFTNLPSSRPILFVCMYVQTAVARMELHPEFFFP